MKKIARLLTALILVVMFTFSLPAFAQGIFVKTLVDELEYGFNHNNNPVNWNLAAWLGGDWNIGSRLNDIELQLRLRYEFSRKFAPISACRGAD